MEFSMETTQKVPIVPSDSPTRLIQCLFQEGKSGLSPCKDKDNSINILLTLPKERNKPYASKEWPTSLIITIRDLAKGEFPEYWPCSNPSIISPALARKKPHVNIACGSLSVVPYLFVADGTVLNCCLF